MLNFWRNNKQITSLCLIFLVSFLGIFALFQPTQAIWNPVSAAIDQGLQKILKFVFSIVGVLLTITAQIFNWALTVTKFSSAPAVKVGWGVARDLVNISLVFILLVISFATILRVERYEMKALLPKLIGVAILVNFSLIACGAVIDASQILTHTFTERATGGDISLALSKGMSFEKNLEMAEGFWENIGAATEATENFLISLLGGTIVILVAAFAFGAGAVLLVIRMVVLWITIILVPFALLSTILPATRDSWTKWIQTFLKWTFFAPAYAFFVYLALIAVEKGVLSEQMLSSAQTFGQDKWTMAGFVNNFFQFDILITYIMVIGLLLGGLIAAQAMSIYGANNAMKVAKFVGGGVAGTANRWLARGAKFGKPGALSRWAEEKGLKRTAKILGTAGEIKRKAASYTSPGVWKKGWADRRKEAEAEAFRLTAPALQDKLTSVFSLGREKSDFFERAERREQIEEEKKIDTVDAQELVGGADRAYKAGDINKTAAYARRLAAQGDLNELLGEYGYEFSAEGMADFTEEKLKPLMGEQKSYRLMHDLNKSAELVGQWKGRVFKGEYNKETGKTKYVKVGTDKAIEEAYKAWSRMDPQGQCRFTHRTSIITEDAEGNDLGIKGHENWIKGLPAGHANRMPDEVIATLMLKHAQEVKSLNRDLYDTLSKTLETRTDDQIKQMREMVKPALKKDKKGEKIPSTTWAATRDNEGRVTETRIDDLNP